jgi:hypothetical protein
MISAASRTMLVESMVFPQSTSVIARSEAAKQSSLRQSWIASLRSQ